MKLLIIPPVSPSTDKITLPQKDVHHIKTVLRKRTGDTLFLSDGTKIYRGIIETITDKEIIVSDITVEKDAPQTTPLTLAHALIKAPNLELSLTKSVETGVATYQPLITERCNMPSRDLVTRKQDRLLKKIDEAAKQCGRPTLMKLQDVLKLEQFLEEIQKEEGLKLFLDITGEKNLSEMTEDIRQTTSICLLIGAEGGFSDEEKQKIKDAGFIAVTCGDFLWRSETAVIVTTGFIQTVLASEVS